MPTASLSTSYTHEQAVAASEWNIVHNLNTSAPSYHCYIEIGGVSTQIIPASAEVVDANTLKLTFTSARAGTARVR